MNKTIALTALLAALSGGAVLAADRGTVEPYGPQSIAEMRAAGRGAIVGTVIEADGRGFVLADASDRVRVTYRDKAAANPVQAGEQATVAGRMEHGEMRARQVVREDGSSMRRHGDDHQGMHEGRAMQGRHGAQEHRGMEERRGMMEERHGQDRRHGASEDRNESRPGHQGAGRRGSH